MKDSKVSKECVENGRNVIVWVLLLFILTIVGALPLIIGGMDQENLPESSPLLPLVFAGIVMIAYTPSLAALLVTVRAGGFRALLGQLGTWRVGASWYLLVLVGPMVLILLADVIYMLLGGASPKQWLAFPSDLAFLGPLLAGSLGEELGWRGFALPRLQKRYSAFWASLIIGVIWGTWHLWPTITPGGLAHLTPADVAQTYIRLIATAIIYTWLYNSTNGSLFLVMAAHAGHNIAIELIQMHADGTGMVPLIIALLYLAVAIAVVLLAGPQTLSRLKDGISERRI